MVSLSKQPKSSNIMEKYHHQNQTKRPSRFMTKRKKKNGRFGSHLPGSSAKRHTLGMFSGAQREELCGRLFLGRCRSGCFAFSRGFELFREYFFLVWGFFLDLVSFPFLGSKGSKGFSGLGVLRFCCVGHLCLCFEKVLQHVSSILFPAVPCVVGFKQIQRKDKAREKNLHRHLSLPFPKAKLPGLSQSCQSQQRSHDSSSHS